jgi:acetyl-CoA carboxylase carboxyltransferase component
VDSLGANRTWYVEHYHFPLRPGPDSLQYDEVLKYGSKIVDGLSSYKQPIFVYIVPNGELRGGAWVVLDPSINPAHMQMYADVNSRAGVLGNTRHSLSLCFRLTIELP